MASNVSDRLVILVVEDESMIRENIVGFLTDAGCLVLEAPSGEQAIQMLDADKPIDVVFTDIRLGGSVNGWDVGEACRATWSDIPIIYTSGQIVEPIRSVPKSLFLNKPYRPEQVLKACQSLCKTASARH